MSIRPWPYPGATREDKAKQVALSYRGLAARIAEGRCDNPAGDLYVLDEHWRELGITWHRPQPLPGDPDDWLPAADIAHYIGRTPKDIYNWAHRGHIEQRCSADGSPEYLLQSVLDYHRRRTITRSAKP